MEIDEAAATEAPARAGADEAAPAMEEGPAAAPGAGKLSKSQKRRQRRQRTAAEAAAADGTRHSQRHRAKAAREREDRAQGNTAAATAKRPKQ